MTDAETNPTPGKDDDEVRVLLVNHRDIVRRGLQSVLTDSDDITVVAEASSLDAAEDLAKDVNPDVAVVDSTGSPQRTIRSVRALSDAGADVPTVIVGHDIDTPRVAAAADAAGYLLDDAREDEVRDAVRRAARGETFVPLTSAASLPPEHRERDPLLTFRERQVLQLIAEGLTNREIGARLGLAEKTVKNYTSALFSKLHIEHRTQAVIYGLMHDSEHVAGEERSEH